jgi:L-rhamnose mutarotase
MGLNRYASVVGLRPERAAEYLRLHADPWPDALDNLRAAGMRNYSIFLRDGLLFSYFEYDGDYEADMAGQPPSEVALRWWGATVPCLDPVESAEPGQLWAPAQEIFHED